jgi:hypothetical protein
MSPALLSYDDPREVLFQLQLEGAPIGVLLGRRLYGALVHLENDEWYIDLQRNHLGRRIIVADEPWPGWRWLLLPFGTL